MVYRGSSQGCHTCIKRRVKCDEQYPSCSRCTASNLTCGGYKKDLPKHIKFKDQTELVRRKHQNQTPNHSVIRVMPSAITNLFAFCQTAEENVALNFFLLDIVTAGRSVNSDRGLFECILPWYETTNDSRATTAAFTATALGLLARRRKTESPLHHARMNQACRSLRYNLEHSKRSRNTDVLMAMLLLQFYEHIIAVNQRRKPSNIHQAAAVTLVRFSGANTFRSDIDRSLLLYVRSQQVATAIRDVRPISCHEIIASSDNPGTNPCSDLDAIGTDVANLQHFFTCLRTNKLGYHGEETLYEHALSIGNRLSIWSEDVPVNWRPIRLTRTKTYQSSTILYEGTCDIYPSAQIALAWNNFRLYKLVILSVLLTYDMEDDVKQDWIANLQDVVDALCRSVPFHLGNRVPGQSTKIEFPGCEGMSAHVKAEHYRHRFAQ